MIYFIATLVIFIFLGIGYAFYQAWNDERFKQEMRDIGAIEECKRLGIKSKIESNFNEFISSE